jgi:hypothetical protein
VITPLQIVAMLNRHAGEFPERSASIDHLWNSATLVWLAANLLRRYAGQNPRMTEPSHAAHLEHALETVAQEMKWLRFCGGDAQKVDLVCAVSTAVAHVERAASLFSAHISDVEGAQRAPDISPATWVGITP